MARQRTLSAQDTGRLVAAIERAAGCWIACAPDLGVFRSVVRRARTVPAGDVPADVITMNSRFALENLNTGEWGCYALVYPEDASTPRGRISVLSPAGMALLGARAGDEVCWTSPAGPEVAKVQMIIHQPEAAMRAAASAPAAAANPYGRRDPAHAASHN